MGRLTDSVEARLAETAAEREQGWRLIEERLSRLTESVEARVAEAAATQTAALDALGRRLDEALEQQVQAAAGDATDDGVARSTDRLDAVSRASRRHAPARSPRLRAASDELEQRVKAAVGRLAESVEGQAGGAGRDARPPTCAPRSRRPPAPARPVFGQVHDRIGALEQEQRTVGAAVGRQAGARWSTGGGPSSSPCAQELEESVAAQFREGRQEIAVAVADAHRRFVVSVDRLEERMNTVAEQSTAAWAAVAGLEATQETVASDGRRIEALEVHTRRTDARLGDVVDAKLAELVDPRLAEIDCLAPGRDRGRRSTPTWPRPGPRSTLALAEGSDEQADRAAADLDARQSALDEQAAHAVDSLEALSASVQSRAGRGAGQPGRPRSTARLAAVEAAAGRRRRRRRLPHPQADPGPGRA